MVPDDERRNPEDDLRCYDEPGGDADLLHRSERQERDHWNRRVERARNHQQNHDQHPPSPARGGVNFIRAILRPDRFVLSHVFSALTVLQRASNSLSVYHVDKPRHSSSVVQA